MKYYEEIAEWEKLRKLMAIEKITMDLAEIYIPCREGRKKAIKMQENQTQSYLNVERFMGDALIALRTLGYKVIKDDNTET